MVVIAISGPPGAGTSSIAKEIAKKLGLSYFSPGQVYKSYSKKSKEAAKALDFWDTEKGKSIDIHHHIDDLQKKEVKKGNIVVDGKLSIFQLKHTADYKIWIDVDLDVRAKRSSGRDNTDFNETKEILAKREKKERENWKKIYGFDF